MRGEKARVWWEVYKAKRIRRNESCTVKSLEKTCTGLGKISTKLHFSIFLWTLTRYWTGTAHFSNVAGEFKTKNTSQYQVCYQDPVKGLSDSYSRRDKRLKEPVQSRPVPPPPSQGRPPRAVWTSRIFISRSSDPVYLMWLMVQWYWQHHNAASGCTGSSR